MKTKKTFIGWIVALFLGGAAAVPTYETMLGSQNVLEPTTLVGSPTAYAVLPAAMSDTDTVTSTATSSYPGDTITQTINLNGAKSVRLNMSLIGGTPTSTFAVRIYGSYDGTNYWDHSIYDATYSTTTLPSYTASSTLATNKTIFEFDPGTSTTSRSLYIPSDGFKELRFVFWGENIAADPDDLVAAWIQATRVIER